MREREPGWSRRWVAAALALTGAACSGAPLGGNLGSGGGGCPDSTRCLPDGTGGALGAGGATGAGGKTSVPDGGQSCDQALANFMAALKAAHACTPGAPNQCQVLVASTLAACPNLMCGSQVYVNDGDIVETARENWLRACDASYAPSCPPSECIESAATPSVCYANDASNTTGTCIATVSNDGDIVAVRDAGESCDQLSTDYAAALTAALACTPGAPNQCQTLVSSVPSACPQTGCGPVLFVNDATALPAAQSRWADQCAQAVACPQIACKIAILPSTCVANDAGGSAGRCVQNVPIEL